MQTPLLQNNVSLLSMHNEALHHTACAAALLNMQKTAADEPRYPHLQVRCCWRWQVYWQRHEQH
jgi:hypothetical protein